MSIADNNLNNNINSDAVQPGLSQEYLASSSGWRSASGYLCYRAISWNTIIGGTVAAAALSLLLMILGAGLGLSSVSVWSGEGVGATGLGIGAIAWLAFTQIAASGTGGFIAGRFHDSDRVMPASERLYQDTANGFLTWALATLMTALLASYLTGSVIGAAAKGASLTNSVELTSGGKMQLLAAGASKMTDPASDGDADNRGTSQEQNLHYMVTSLFRGQQPAAEKNGQTPASSAANQQQVEEVLVIFASNLNESSLPVEDMRYIAGIVSKRTGIAQAEAEERVTTTFTHMKEKRATLLEETKAAAEKARKVAAATAFWFFVFLFLGALSASLSAVWGGKCRDTAA